MNYRLRRQGKDLGTFSLEELRRRRLSGALTGAEYVQGKEMADWQPLDLVLQRGPLKPPPLPPQMGYREPGHKVIWAVVGVAVLLFVGTMVYMGFKVSRSVRLLANSDHKGGVEAARKPVVCTSKTLTAADVAKKDKAFRLRQWLEGYEHHGQRNPSCDQQVVQFLKAWLAKNFDGPEAANLPAPQDLGDQLANNPACTDPLVLTVAAVNAVELGEKVRRLERAVSAFEGASHKGYPRWYATVLLLAEVSSQRSRSTALNKAALQWFKDSFTDGSFTPEDQSEIGEILINGWGYKFFHRNRTAICSFVQQRGKPYEWLAEVLEGERHIIEAWIARGGSYADSVSQQGWQGFSSHLASARKSLTQAWKQQPEAPLAPCRMIYVSLGDSDIEEMRAWFDRTVSAQVDYARAWKDFRWGLRPRWYGSTEALLALGETAINTKRFDTDVPRMFFDSVSDVQSEEKLEVGQYLYGRSNIWPHLRYMYEGYVAEPAQAHTRTGWRTTYSAVAYLAGQYETARTQLEALEWQPQKGNLSGWCVDLSLMPLEVAARTGPLGTQVHQAEAARQSGTADAALRLYSPLKDSAGADPRTKEFIAHRLAGLELEKRLEGGGWVDFLPERQDAPGWVAMRGTIQEVADGVVEVKGGEEGHFLFSQARVGLNFEVRGEFDVVRSTTADFQAGLVLGLPDPSEYTWYAFRMKRNDREGDVASLGCHWVKPQRSTPVRLERTGNAFELRYRKGVVNATVNGKEVFKDADPPRTIKVSDANFMLGLGAFNDTNETVIRYRRLQVRKLKP